MAELFEKFELHRELRWRRMLRLAGGSLAFHLILLACVLYIPAVRDALNISGAFSNAKYVSKDYKKTHISDQQVTMLDFRDKFQYPPGYFSTEVPMADPMLMPQIISQEMPMPVATPTPLPPPPMIIKPPRVARVRPTPQVRPSPAASPAASPQVASNNANTNGSAIRDGQSKEDVDKTLDRMASENNVERPEESQINKKPLEDWLASAGQQWKDGKLDLSQPVEIVIVAERGPSGKFENAQVVYQTGDPQLQEVARHFAEAIIDSNVLYFLQDVNKLKLTMKMDQNTVTASVESEVDSERRARQLATTYNIFLLGGQQIKKGQDEEILYKNTKITSDGKMVIVNFAMPRQSAGEMLKKRLPTT